MRELVIKIPEEEYQNYLKMRPAYPEGVFCYIKAIQNGKPLPKGHGDLIDMNEITAFRELECNGHDVESLDEFTVIIEADKGKGGIKWIKNC
ncbi:MAG TPA: hypothetical protein DHV37_05965 [Erysipelotrichaceae bacterium]|nr:hypothetical protein [Erysipelotrichaceae bacterium]